MLLVEEQSTKNATGEKARAASKRAEYYNATCKRAKSIRLLLTREQRVLE